MLAGAVFVMARAAPEAVTVVMTVAELLAVLGSGLVEVTLTVFVSVAAAVGSTTMLMVSMGASLLRLPRLQVTVVVPAHEPLEGVAETRVTPAGSTSVTVTFVALTSGPLLTTEI